MISASTISRRASRSVTRVINENPQHLEHSRAPSIARARAQTRQYPEDLLGALVFLSSADSDFVTGQTIAVDGGATNN